MKTSDIDNLISLFKNDATLLSMVDSDNIRIGWTDKISDFPSVIITIAGDDIVGKLGYGTSSSGSKERIDTGRIQIDVYSDTSARNCSLILDRIVTLLLQTDIFLTKHKISDISFYDDDTKTWRRTSAWEFNNVHVD